MRCPRIVFQMACLACVLSGDTRAEGDWRSLGPGVGYAPEAFFVSENAVYVGLVEEDLTTGLGLFRYRFDTEQWDLFAWGGFRILGIAVWGEADRNILISRYGDRGNADVLRSTDGGSNWVTTYHRDYWEIVGLTQAPTDTARVLMHHPKMYSSDGGWSWNAPGGSVPWGETRDMTFNPSDAQVAYFTSASEIEVDMICKSTDGGAYWRYSLIDGWVHSGIEVERQQTNRVLCGTTGDLVHVSTDAGETWSMRDAPFRAWVPDCPPWSTRSLFVLGTTLDESSYDVWRTGDLAESWQPCGEGLPAAPGELWIWSQLFIESHPTQPILYAALKGAGVWMWDLSASAILSPEGSTTPRIELLLYPNPAAEGFRCAVRIPESAPVTLALHDARGRLVQKLREGFLVAGDHVFTWRAGQGTERRLANGTYYVRLDAGPARETRSLVILR